MSLPESSRQTLACGCVIKIAFVPNELPDRDGNVYPFMMQPSIESMCLLHSQQVKSGGPGPLDGVSISGTLS